MSQVLIICQEKGAPDPSKGLLDRALEIYRQEFGLAPSRRLVTNHFACAVFDPQFGSGFRFDTDTESGRWSLLVGSWIDRRHCSGPIDLGDVPDAVKDIHGSYLLAAGSMQKNAIALATDPLGIYHVYRRKLGECTLYCTSSLVLALLEKAEWLDDSLAEFLATGTIYENRSFFEGITKLRPASIHLHRQGSYSEFTYWDLPALLNESPTRADVDALSSELVDSVSGIAERYDDPLFDLTGGFDSRAIVGAAMRSGMKCIHTDVTGPPTSRDVSIANLVAKTFGFDHRTLSGGFDDFDAWFTTASDALTFTDGEYDIMEYANVMRVHRQMAPLFSCSVNGSAGEAYRGYWWELLLPLPTRRGGFDARRLASARFITTDIACDLVPDRDHAAMVDHFANVIERTIAPLGEARQTACMDYIYLVMRMQRWQGRIASSTMRIWNCFSPLAFRPLLELGITVRFMDKVNNRLMRRLILNLDRDLARLPLSGGYPATPLDFRTLPLYLPMITEFSKRLGRRMARKLSASPYEPPAHLSTDVKDVFVNERSKSLLTPESMASSRLLDEHGLVRFLEHARNEPARYRRHIGRLITLELLVRKIDTIRPVLSA